MVRLICNTCGYDYLAHSGHYWRYPARANKCPQENCDGRGYPNEAGREQMRSRNSEIKQMRHEREKKSRLEGM